MPVSVVILPNRPRIQSVFRIVAWYLFCAGAALTNGEAPKGASDLWTTHIQPILSHNCFKCHSELKQKAGLDVSSPALILKGGERGPALVPGKPADSLIFQFIQPGADPHMPPRDHQLTDEEIGTIKHWITTFKPVSTPSGTNASATSSWDAPEYPWFRPNEPAKQPPKSLGAAGVIDFYIKSAWHAARVKPAAPCDDRTFIRRAYLDLAGRIPTTEEGNAFLNSRNGKKRAQLVDRLIASSEFAQNMAETFDVLLTGRRSTDSSWKEYLRYAFASNRPWNAIARDLVLARPSSRETKGAVHYLYSRNNNYQAMAEAVAPAFLGVQVNCAQCHNHPLAPEIKQKHYWGLVAFFNRSKNMQADDGPALAESAIGGFVKFANLKKESQEAELTFVSNKIIPEKRPGDNEKEDDVPEKYLVPPGSGKKSAPVPRFSRREQLANLVTENNPLLARTFVNRIWSILMGRGIVHPVDRMDSVHPPSHPDLLAWLAHDFEQNSYDVQRLIRNICLTEAYQLDSKWSSGPKPQPELFAHAIERPLRAEALLRSTLVATGARIDSNGQIAGFDDFASVFNDRFPDVQAAESNPNLRQGLFLANNPKFDELLKARSGNTTEALVKTGGPREQVDQAFLRVYGRLPDREEKRQSLEFLGKRMKNPERGMQQLLWALLTSAEFRFNH